MEVMSVVKAVILAGVLVEAVTSQLNKNTKITVGLVVPIKEVSKAVE